MIFKNINNIWYIHMNSNAISYVTRIRLKILFNPLFHSQRSGNLREFRRMKYRKLHSVQNSM